LAEGYAKNGRLDDAREELQRAVGAVDETGQHFFDAELYRIGGELALHSSPPGRTEAERYFRKAIEIARAQEARWWQLRATMNLARLLGDTNRRDEALTMLTEIYNWFTEGFDLADL
jgi:predicted ATPase